MGYDVIEEAENYAWWSSLGRDTFAELIVGGMVTIAIDGQDFKIEDFLNRDQVKEIWDASVEEVESWARERYGRAHQNGFVLWMATGMVIGYIRGCSV